MKKNPNNQDKKGKSFGSMRERIVPKKAKVKYSRVLEKSNPTTPEPTPTDETPRLNKFIANAGICSRRKADEYIEQGLVTVNGEVVTQMGYRVQQTDAVHFQGKLVEVKENKVYILLNKPRNTITTANDEKGRRTVLDVIAGACPERVFPVGRLDRDTTGLLLLTNDGELAKKLTHPKHKVKKIYQVILDKKLKLDDSNKIIKGLELEDGIAQVDHIAYLEDKSDNVVNVEIHIGKNRIVRRIFEHLGYKVEKLDRIYLGGLTKKNLPRGHYRFLTEREIIMLKHFT